MIARFITLILITVLVLPVTTLTRPAETSPSPWGEAAVEAKGKKHKNKKAKQPQFTTGSRTERQTVTQTFTNTMPIAIPNGAPGTNKGPGNPYPSTIEVSGFSNGVITDVNLILDDLTHTLPADIDLLLSRSDDRRALVMSDVGVDRDRLNIDLTLDDEAAASLPEDQLTSGAFRPTNIGSNDDTFDAPAPNPNGSVALSTFDGADPNGTWQVWVMDDLLGDYGDIGGWAVQITAEVDVQIEEQIPAPLTKARKHKHKGRR